MNKIYICIAFILLLPIRLNAQDSTGHAENPELNCATFVKDLDQEYNNGHYDVCFAMLKKGFGKCTFSKREKEDIWLTSALVNLERDNILEVRKCFVNLLKNNPLFTPKEGIYRQSFYTHFKTIEVRPLIVAGIRSGFNLPNYKTTNVFSVLNNVDYSLQYQSVPGYQAGVYIEYQFFSNITLGAEIDYSTANFKRSLSAPGERFALDYSETLSFLDGHFDIKKYFGRGKFKPYISGGICLSMLQKSSAQINVKYSRTDPYTKEIDHFASSMSIDQKPFRNQQPTYLTAGLGCAYRIKNFIISVDARFMNGLSNMINPDKRLNNTELLYNFYYIDNDVFMRKTTFSASVGYVFKYAVREKKNNE
jgi:hypothetical protein